LVLDFHGLGGTASGERSSSGWLALSNQDTFILVNPQGVGNSWNLTSGTGGCCPPAFDQNIDDVGFVRALIDKLEGEGCVDTKRIYATGMSNGGGMTIRLACEVADVIAAVAPNAFDLIQNQPCTPSRPITMIDYRGTADNLVPYNGGTTTIPGDTRQVTFLGANPTFEQIRILNGCTGTPQTTNNICSTYTTCNQGVQTTLCSVQNGGHSPGDASVGWSVIKNYVLP
jgi:polyhydroxybutyrate depolymerase